MSNRKQFLDTLALYERDNYHPALTTMGLVSWFWVSEERADELLAELSNFLQTRTAEMMEFNAE